MQLNQFADHSACQLHVPSFPTAIRQRYQGGPERAKQHSRKSPGSLAVLCLQKEGKTETNWVSDGVKATVGEVSKVDDRPLCSLNHSANVCCF